MSLRLLFSACLVSAITLHAQTAPITKPPLFPGPADARAQTSFHEAATLAAQHRLTFALDAFKKADKQDGNRCAACADQILALATATADFKLADAASHELIALAATPEAQAAAHIERAKMLMAWGKDKKKNDCFAEGQKESDTALALEPGNKSALFVKGMCLANEQQDEQARQVFTELAPRLVKGSVDAQRVARYAERPELVRARLAPGFAVRTLDGKRVSMDELRDKVVLIDFWATWCGPCREALPHMQKIAKQFEGQPLVVLSISLDSDANDAKWKDFVAKNGMTWLQYRDGGFSGPIAEAFNVKAIPHTFTIDTDGVLQDEHIGDGNIEGKLKKLLAQARQREEAPKAQVASAGGGSR